MIRKWFAWRPVKVMGVGTQWFKWVERHKTFWGSYYYPLGTVERHKKMMERMKKAG